MRVLELYSGIGGMHFALKESGIDGIVVASFEINTVANDVYKHNFPSTSNINRSIDSITAEEINKLNIDCILMSPPCQPFTRVGLKKDLLDNRCSSLLHILNIIPQINNLKYVLVENVKGFEHSSARNELTTCLELSNFNYKELIISPCQFGIPNTRFRYYLLAKTKGEPFIFTDGHLANILTNNELELLKSKAICTYCLRNLSDKNSCKIQHYLEEDVDNKYFISEDTLKKRIKLLDVRTTESVGSCCFTKAYTHYAEGTGSVISLHSKHFLEEQLKCFKEDTSSENNKVQMLADLKIRYFTPTEVARLMHFPKEFTFPDNTTDKQKYRLLGNSLNVYVVSQLIFLLNYK